MQQSNTIVVVVGCGCCCTFYLLYVRQNINVIIAMLVFWLFYFNRKGSDVFAIDRFDALHKDQRCRIVMIVHNYRPSRVATI
jgi:hypothetical protein